MDALIAQVSRLASRPKRAVDPSGFPHDPVGYCGRVLGVRLTPTQAEIARALTERPYKVLVKAGHNVGKSFLAACLVNWWHDNRKPGICLTTAPTDRQVRDILWKEVRLLRNAAGLSGFPGPKICRLESGPDHFAHGFTARDGTRFQGHHSRNVFILFDEAEGVESIFWQAMLTMLQGDSYAFLAIYNPTLQAGPTVDAERATDPDGSHQYRTFTMSCLDHPNVRAEIEGRHEDVIPNAVRLGPLKSMLADWSTVVPPESPREAGDVELDGVVYRPGPVAECRILGRRPTSAFNSVWSAAVFEYACGRELPASGRLQIGCDVARFGDDFTAIHVKAGGASLHHESYNGADSLFVAGRLMALASEWGGKYGLDGRRVLLVVDNTGQGAADMVDRLGADGWNVVGHNVCEGTPDDERFFNMRSALWIGLAEEAAAGNVSFSRLPPDVRRRLESQFTAPLYHFDGRGRMVVEPKDETKKRLKRSPDDADAVLLAYADVGHVRERLAGRVTVPV